MTKTELLRLYLRDQDPDNARFSDEDLTELLKLNNDSATGAAALGWLLTASELTDAPVSASVGNTSESYGAPTERYKVAMNMHHYWKGQYESEVGSTAGVARWMELVPDFADGTEGIVSELVEHKQWLRDNWVPA